MKMAYRTIPIMALVLLTTSWARACSRPPGFGFIVQSVLRDNTAFPLPEDSFITAQELQGVFNAGNATTLGDTSPFDGITRESGQLPELGKATPASWTITYLSGPCSIQDPLLVGPNVLTRTFQPNSSPQQIFCVHDPPPGQGALSANPNSFDTSVCDGNGVCQVQMIMTLGTPWPRTPGQWVNFNLRGDILQQGTIGGVTDAYDCWGYFNPMFDNITGSSTQYIWLTDSGGSGIASVEITVTNGTSNGG